MMVHATRGLRLSGLQDDKEKCQEARVLTIFEEVGEPFYRLCCRWRLPDVSDAESSVEEGLEHGGE